MDPIRTIVVATDFSPLARSASMRAAMLAQLDGGTVHLVHALRFPLVESPYGVSIPPSVWENIRAAARQRIESERKAIEASGVPSVTTEIAESVDATVAISAAVEARGADLVAMGTHGHRGLTHAVLGSVAERTLRTVSCPVLATKEDEAEARVPVARMLVAVDFSEHSEVAVEVAGALARRLGASIVAVHALDLPDDYRAQATPFGAELEEKIQRAAVDRLASVRDSLESDGVPVTLHVRRGRPSAVISAEAERAGSQLIVMGTRGRTGLSHLLLGSVAERTLRMAPCSVLAVKAT